MSVDARDRLDPLLLDKYFAGDCDAGDVARVERWIAAAPERREEVDLLRVAWRATRRHSAEPATRHLPAHGGTASTWWDADAMWTGVAERLDAPEAVVRRPAFVVHNVGRSPALAAAAVLIVLGGVVLARHVGRVRQRSGPTVQLATANAQRLTTRLSDGTMVTLAPASRLTLRPGYRGGRRDVDLIGEAYFDVAHDPSTPFAVHAGRTVTRDIGTRFDVRSYVGDTTVQVVVAEGRVAIGVTDAVPAAMLRAGDLAAVGRSGTTRVTSGVDTHEYVGWTDGRLSFHTARLREVVRELSRWYNVPVTLADSVLGDRLYSATLNGEPITEVLDALSASVAARYDRVGTGYVLSPVRHGGHA